MPTSPCVVVRPAGKGARTEHATRAGGAAAAAADDAECISRGLLPNVIGAATAAAHACARDGRRRRVWRAGGRRKTSLCVRPKMSAADPPTQWWQPYRTWTASDAERLERKTNRGRPTGDSVSS